MKLRFVYVLVPQSYPTLQSMDYSPPGSSVHGIFQARILEWVAISYTREFSWPRGWTGSPALQADSTSHQGRWNLGGGSFFNFVVVQSLSPVWLIVTPWTTAPPGSPVLHYLLEFAQTHVHWVSDVNQPSHPLASPSPPALNLSRHQGLFQWVSFSHQVAKVLELPWWLRW